MLLRPGLKRYIGRTVYFSQPKYGLRVGEQKVYTATLEEVKGTTAVVTWQECLCLDWHDASVECGFKIRETLSIFSIKTRSPATD